MVDERKAIMIRLTDALKDEMKAVAKATGMSQNSWAIAAITDRIRLDKKLLKEDLNDGKK